MNTNMIIMITVIVMILYFFIYQRKENLTVTKCGKNAGKCPHGQCCSITGVCGGNKLTRDSFCYNHTGSEWRGAANGKYDG